MPIIAPANIAVLLIIKNTDMKALNLKNLNKAVMNKIRKKNWHKVFLKKFTFNINIFKKYPIKTTIDILAYLIKIISIYNFFNN
jgi:hypothetical protein